MCAPDYPVAPRMGSTVAECRKCADPDRKFGVTGGRGPLSATVFYAAGKYQRSLRPPVDVRRFSSHVATRHSLMHERACHLSEKVGSS